MLDSACAPGTPLFLGRTCAASPSEVNTRGASKNLWKKPSHVFERPKKDRTDRMVECGSDGLHDENSERETVNSPWRRVESRSSLESKCNRKCLVSIADFCFLLSELKL